MTALDIWLLFVVIPVFRTSLMVLSAVMAVVNLICAFGHENENLEKGKPDKEMRRYIRGLIFFMIIFAVSFSVPSQKEMALIYIAPKIINNQNIQQIPAEILRYVEKEMRGNGR